MTGYILHKDYMAAMDFVEEYKGKSIFDKPIYFRASLEKSDPTSMSCFLEKAGFNPHETRKFMTLVDWNQEI